MATAPKSQYTDPIAEGLLALFNAHADRQQADLDLQRAAAAEQFVGRTTVPGVFAQLEARAQKRAQAREKIEKQSQQQAMAPQEMLPPMTEVSGQAQRPSSPGLITGLANAAADIYTQTRGGAAVQQQAATNAPPGATPGINPNAPPPGTPSAQAGAAMPQPQPVSLPANPPLPPPGASQPGKVTVTREPLSTGQRITKGVTGALGAGLGALGRNPGAVMAGGQEIGQAVTGEGDIVAVQRAPSLDEQAAQLSRPLSVYRARMDSPNPIVARDAANGFQNGMEQIEKDFGPEMAQVVRYQVANNYLEQRLAAEAMNEDPKVLADRAKARATFAQQEVAARAWEKLDAGTPLEKLSQAEQLAIKAGQRGIDANVNVTMPPPLEKGTRKMVETNTYHALGNVNTAQRIVAITGEFPEFFQYGAGKAAITIEMADKSGSVGAKSAALASLSTIGFSFSSWQDAQAYARRYRVADRQFGELTADVVRPLAGATMTPAELEFYLKLLPRKDMSAETARAAAEDFIYVTGLDLFRDRAVLESGFELDPANAMGFADTANAARQAFSAQVDELVAGGATQDEALVQASNMFKQVYGLDTARLMAGSSENIPDF